MSRRPLRVDALVGTNIRIWRLTRGLSQSALGRQIGVTFQQVQQYENGGNRVGAGRLAQISHVLDVPLLTLFEGNSTARLGADDPFAPGRALLAQPHAIRLARAFHNISSTKTRLAVVHLIEAVAARGRRGASRRAMRAAE
jgi:transcriptional regulator with XRE-family HTH domain